MEKIYEILQNTFGYKTFKFDQENIIESLLAKENILAVMPTGSGKSLCFQVPALAQPGLAIVVSPLVALMQDQVASLKLVGVACDAINSTQSRDTNIAIWQKTVRGQIKILYMSPERLMDTRMLQALAKLPISFFAVDEAHCISHWGASFRPEYDDLAKLQTLFPTTPIIALTATADEATRYDICQKLFNGKNKTFISGFNRPNIKLNVALKQPAKNGGWQQQLLDYLANKQNDSGIVYCLSRKTTESVEQLLCQNGFNALAYHAGLDKDTRLERQNKFFSESGTIIAATIAFGMGLNKSDVRFVFHVDLPSSIETYYQEIGRAGRDGKPADATMIYGTRDIQMRRQFIEQEETSEQHKQRQHAKLNALVTYCESHSCRRTALLAYFGEQIENCQNCDICQNPPKLEDGTAQAKLVIETIIATGNMYGRVHIIDVLLGLKNEKIAKAKHDKLSQYGKGKNFGDKNYWQIVIKQMIASDLLYIDIAGYHGLKLTAKGEEFFHNPHEYSFAFASPPVLEIAEKKIVPKIDVEISEHDNELLGCLKKQRLELARKMNVPAFHIFTDKSLIHMAQMRPSNKQEFAEIHGVGEKKLKDFADIFLSVIASS